MFLLCLFTILRLNRRGSSIWNSHDWDFYFLLQAQNALVGSTHPYRKQLPFTCEDLPSPPILLWASSCRGHAKTWDHLKSSFRWVPLGGDWGSPPWLISYNLMVSAGNPGKSQPILTYFDQAWLYRQVQHGWWAQNSDDHL